MLKVLKNVIKVITINTKMKKYGKMMFLTKFIVMVVWYLRRKSANFNQIHAGWDSNAKGR